MEIFNEFFVSFEVVQNPIVVGLSENLIGRIILFPSKRNIFINKEGFCFIYDNRTVETCKQIEKFRLYTATPLNDLNHLCMSIWDEEFGIQKLESHSKTY